MTTSRRRIVPRGGQKEKQTFPRMTAGLSFGDQRTPRRCAQPSPKLSSQRTRRITNSLQTRAKLPRVVASSRITCEFSLHVTHSSKGRALRATFERSGKFGQFNEASFQRKVHESPATRAFSTRGRRGEPWEKGGRGGGGRAGRCVVARIGDFANR